MSPLQQTVSGASFYSMPLSGKERGRVPLLRHTFGPWALVPAKFCAVLWAWVGRAGVNLGLLASGSD